MKRITKVIHDVVMINHQAKDLRLILKYLQSCESSEQIEDLGDDYDWEGLRKVLLEHYGVELIFPDYAPYSEDEEIYVVVDGDSDMDVLDFELPEGVKVMSAFEFALLSQNPNQEKIEQLEKRLSLPDVSNQNAFYEEIASDQKYLYALKDLFIEYMLAFADQEGAVVKIISRHKFSAKTVGVQINETKFHFLSDRLYDAHSELESSNEWVSRKVFYDLPVKKVKKAIAEIEKFLQDRGIELPLRKEEDK